MKEKEINKPYVISADVNGLMNRWSKESGYTFDGNGYFQAMLKDLRSTLEGYFSAVDIVPEEYLQSGLKNLAAKAQTPVISLDRAYVTGQEKNIAGFLDVTRSVDVSLQNTGLADRRNGKNINDQIAAIAQKQQGGVISLLDDVIFEGKTMLEIINGFQAKGVTVEKVIAGIAIKDGIILLEQQGIRVEPLLVYDQVTDEICERDFVVGAPLSGRTVVTERGLAGAPYLYPFGKPVEWASIPEDKASDFSKFCLAQSIDLWRRAERSSGASIPTRALSKPVFGLPEDISIVSSLMRVKKEKYG